MSGLRSGGGRAAGADAASAGSCHSSYVTAEQPAPPQQFCQVCNGRISEHGTPVTVAYSVAMAEPKTFWQKIGLRAAKRPRQVPFHYKVCNDECAARAEQDAGSFYVKTFSERGASR